MYKLVSELTFVWSVNVAALVSTSQELAGQLTVVESLCKIGVLILSMIFTCYKIVTARRDSKQHNKPNNNRTENQTADFEKELK